MHKLYKLIAVLLAFNFAVSACDASYQIDALKSYADGLNVEGGLPAKHLSKNQIWANLVVVLDRPFDDGMDLSEITAQNSYPLKESSILSYNEPQVNLAYLNVIHYYIIHAHAIANKPDGEIVRLTVQVHRNGTGLPHLALLEKLLQKGYPDLLGMKDFLKGSVNNSAFTYYYPMHNVQVEFRYGYSQDTITNYSNQDIILSIGLASGFNSGWKSGTLLVPDRFVPFELGTMTLFQSMAFDAKNHLAEALPAIIENQSSQLVDLINKDFLSPNKVKAHQVASRLKHEDFHKATLLQADGLFNPKDLPWEFNVK